MHQQSSKLLQSVCLSKECPWTDEQRRRENHVVRPDAFADGKDNYLHGSGCIQKSRRYPHRQLQHLKNAIANPKTPRKESM